MGRFDLVDFAAAYQKGFRNHIVSIRDVPALIQSFNQHGCFATYFFFSDELLTYMSAQSDTSSPSVSGYQGKVWAPFVPIDLDHLELTPAQEAAKSLCAFLLGKWGVTSDALQIYFSGAKGFHLMLDTRLFGRVMPSKNLPTVFDSLRRHLAQEIPESLRGTIDLSIKDRVRLLRLPNTIHESSKLYKIILSHTELGHLGPKELRDLARTPRPLTLTDETGFLSRANVAENPAAAEMFHRIRRQTSRLTRKPFAYKFRRPADLSSFQFPCAGAQKVWESHIEPGQRNNCAIRLVSELRLLGLTGDEARQKLFEWNERNNIELPAAELQSVVYSGYQHRFPYRYSCRDSILRQFCPLPNLQTCREHVANRANPREVDTSDVSRRSTIVQKPNDRARYRERKIK
jgi:Primase C terminal 1 (PriCT-1)